MTDPILYTPAEAAALLQVPTNWLREHVTAGAVPHRRIGRYVRFTREDLDQIVEQTARKPVSRTTRTTRRTA
ncbi:MAG: helix-turn-helix domain-containing protein [Blastococcus sp.]